MDVWNDIQPLLRNKKIGAPAAVLFGVVWQLAGCRPRERFTITTDDLAVLLGRDRSSILAQIKKLHRVYDLFHVRERDRWGRYQIDIYRPAPGHAVAKLDMQRTLPGFTEFAIEILPAEGRAETARGEFPTVENGAWGIPHGSVGNSPRLVRAVPIDLNSAAEVIQCSHRESGLSDPETWKESGPLSDPSEALGCGPLSDLKPLECGTSDPAPARSRVTSCEGSHARQTPQSLAAAGSIPSDPPRSFLPVGNSPRSRGEFPTGQNERGEFPTAAISGRTPSPCPREVPRGSSARGLSSSVLKRTDDDEEVSFLEGAAFQGPRPLEQETSSSSSVPQSRAARLAARLEAAASNSLPWDAVHAAYEEVRKIIFPGCPRPAAESRRMMMLAAIMGQGEMGMDWARDCAMATKQYARSNKGGYLRSVLGQRLEAAAWCPKGDGQHWIGRLQFLTDRHVRWRNERIPQAKPASPPSPPAETPAAPRPTSLNMDPESLPPDEAAFMEQWQRQKRAKEAAAARPGVRSQSPIPNP